jgi:hypothetical protein
MPAPAAGINLFSGTSGDFYAIGLAFDNLTDIVTVPGSPPTPLPFIEMTKWSLKLPLQGPTFFGFRSPADSFEVLGPIRLKGGTSDWTFSVEGALNGDSGASAATAARARVGGYLYCHLIFHKASGYGYRGIVGKVIDFGPGSDSESNKPSPVRIECQGAGLVPVPSFAP